MTEFVNTGGATIRAEQKQIFKKNKPKTIVLEESDPTLNMTPQQKRAHKKEQEIQKQIEERKQAAIAAKSNYDTAKGRKF